MAHRVALWEGFMLLGLNFAVFLSPLSAEVETASAGLLVASSAFQDGSSIVNWLQGVADEFRQRSLGLVLATINALLATGGIAILVVGVFRGSDQPADSLKQTVSQTSIEDLFGNGLRK